MLEELAQVVKVDKHRVWVASTQAGACGGCSQKATCTTQAIASVLKKKSVAVEVDSAISLNVGDTVSVAIDERLLLLASLLMYFSPLVALFMGGGIVDWFVPDDDPLADLWIASGVLVSLVLSLWAIHKLQYLFLFNYCVRPVVVKKL